MSLWNWSIQSLSLMFTDRNAFVLGYPHCLHGAATAIMPADNEVYSLRTEEDSAITRVQVYVRQHCNDAKLDGISQLAYRASLWIQA